MLFKYKKEIIVMVLAIFASTMLVTYIKCQFFDNKNIAEPIDNIIAYYKEPVSTNKVLMATTKKVRMTSTTPIKEEVVASEKVEEEKQGKYPYSVAPTFEDDGSIIYDGLTLTELTNKLNKTLGSYMTNTGYFFAQYTKDTGLDPYLSVAIVMLETGCKWNCSSLTVKCNNIGGLKGGKSCNGGSYRRYDTLEEGIDGYLNIIYNNYYLKGMTTPETMASTYAASSQWAMKVNKYIDEIKAN